MRVAYMFVHTHLYRRTCKRTFRAHLLFIRRFSRQSWLFHSKGKQHIPFRFLFLSFEWQHFVVLINLVVDKSHRQICYRETASPSDLLSRRGRGLRYNVASIASLGLKRKVCSFEMKFDSGEKMRQVIGNSKNGGKKFSAVIQDF